MVTLWADQLLPQLLMEQFDTLPKGYSRKKYLGGEDGRQYIFLWVVGAESFQIIWVVGVRPNLITWQSPAILDAIKLCNALNI